MNEPLAQDKQELIREVAAAALVKLDKRETQRIKRSAPREILEQLFKGLGNPQPAEENIIPPLLHCPSCQRHFHDFWRPMAKKYSSTL